MNTHDRIEELKGEAEALSALIQRTGKKSPQVMDRLQEIRDEIKRLEELEQNDRFLSHLDYFENVTFA